ncbi:MAG: adenosylcobinamide-phosphate synthase CbiB [Thermodesulfobacteriota bacterium]
MIPLPLQIIIALGLDQVLGDPRWLPHPVRLIGWLQLRLEGLTRLLLPGRARLAGIITTSVTLLLVAGLSGGLLLLAGLYSPLAHDTLAILILYTCFAGRDLDRHARRVAEALRAGNLEQARARVGLIVGRDTTALDWSGVARAAVESVAESLVDGVCAPIFYAVIGGPVGALLYKAINTGDSMFGYKNERYQEFGWGPARLDDLANYVPARLTALVMPLAAAILGLRAKRAWRVMLRDHGKHPSPNAGLPEAAMAGALGVSLGGPAVYGGQEHVKPLLGDPGRPLTAQHIGLALRLMWVTMILVTAALLLARLLG